MSDVRTLKLVRLRVGVFGTGAAVGERQEPPRYVHVVDISADLDAPEGVTVCCGAHFAPSTLVEVPWMTMEPHRVCRVNSGAKAEVVMDDAHNDASVSSNPSARIQVTAQWQVSDPVIHVSHAAGSDFVDVAVSGSIDSDVITRVQIRDPLAVLRAGHNLLRAGLSLAETRGVDIEDRYRCPVNRHPLTRSISNHLPVVGEFDLCRLATRQKKTVTA